MLSSIISHDDRVIDGGRAVQLGVKLKQIIEDSQTLLIEG
jgi:pyruvate/2-oxoglutarate dehydrogenase complex dihydrolipoamide acyltransferase (E2) component